MSDPVIKSAADLDGNSGKKVTVYGLYGVQSLGGHSLMVKQPDGTWKQVKKEANLKIGKGSFIALENRSEEEMKEFEGKKVIITGKLIIPSSKAKSEIVMAEPEPVPKLVEISDIKAQ